MRNWLQQLPRRQQVLLMIMLFVSIGALLLLGVVLPLHRNLDAANSRLRNTREMHAEVLALVTKLQSLQDGADAGATPGDLTAVLTASLQAQGLQPSRLQQGNAGELQLRLEAVEFATLIAWLAGLEQTPSVQLVNLSLVQGRGDTANVNVGFRAL